MTEKIIPAPCGHEAVAYPPDYGISDWVVGCIVQPCWMGPPCPTRKAAIAVWEERMSLKGRRVKK
jgi:hypothetical protein